MRLTRLYVAEPLREGALVELPKDTAAHVAKVLRAHAGDPVSLFNGDGQELAGVIETVRGNRVSVQVGARLEVDAESPLATTLIQCVPRGDRMDFIVQKATELGVHRIVPVLSKRSVVRLDGAQAAAKQAHWQAVAVSACEQSGRTRLPVVETPVALLNHLGSLAPGGLRLVLDPYAQGEAAGLEAAAGAVDLAVGPEGGFEAAELEAFALAGFRALKLGPRILRTETAAIAGLTYLQAIWGDLSASSC
ncbi:MAG TPA: 16S rRNA (uracil(1498)-N(3))-methyltransferase [Steroidobacteraceae bacterium]